MNIYITNTFKRSAKKLPEKQKIQLKDAIKKVENNPEIGTLKLGDLAGVRVYKFHFNDLLVLLAYLYNEKKNEITLLSFGSHQNFYEDLKKTGLRKP